MRQFNMNQTINHRQYAITSTNQITLVSLKNNDIWLSYGPHKVRMPRPFFLLCFIMIIKSRMLMRIVECIARSPFLVKKPFAWHRFIPPPRLGQPWIFRMCVPKLPCALHFLRAMSQISLKFVSRLWEYEYCRYHFTRPLIMVIIVITRLVTSVVSLEQLPE